MVVTTLRTHCMRRQQIDHRVEGVPLHRMKIHSNSNFSKGNQLTHRFSLCYETQGHVRIVSVKWLIIRVISRFWMFFLLAHVPYNLYNTMNRLCEEFLAGIWEKINNNNRKSRYDTKTMYLNEQTTEQNKTKPERHTGEYSCFWFCCSCFIVLVVC